MIYQVLNEIQKKLIAKKDSYNDFGKYPYRSAEGILAEVKQYLGDCVVIVNEELKLIGDRYYVVSTATLTDGKDSVSATSQAREDLELKNMNSGQLSGSTSSYAKKYALCNLFAIDGVEKDLDGIEDDVKKTPSKTPSKVPKETPKETPKEVVKEAPKEVVKETPKETPKVPVLEESENYKIIRNALNTSNVTYAQVCTICKRNNTTIADLTSEQLDTILKIIYASPKKEANYDNPL